PRKPPNATGRRTPALGRPRLTPAPPAPPTRPPATTPPRRHRPSTAAIRAPATVTKRTQTGAPPGNPRRPATPWLDWADAASPVAPANLDGCSERAGNSSSAPVKPSETTHADTAGPAVRTLLVRSQLVEGGRDRHGCPI